MRTAAAAFAFVALTAGLAAADTEHVNRTFTLPGTGEVRLNTFSGHVRIVGADTRQVTIDATRHGTRSQLDSVKLEIEQHGSMIEIETNRRERSWFTWWGHSDVVDTDFEITVPRQTKVSVHSFSSLVEVGGVGSDLDVHTFSAPVRLDGVTGRTMIHTFSGPIGIKAGDLSDTGSIDVDTFSGNVDLRLPPSTHAVADFRSFSGRLTSQEPLLLRSSSRRETTAEFDGPGPARQIRVKTFSSNLRIDR